MYNKTSQQLAKEIVAEISTPSFRTQYVNKKASQEFAVAATPKKLSIIKRAVLSVAFTTSILTAGLFAVNSAIPTYEGTTDVTIAWGTEVSTIEDAIRKVNPTATDKHVADAVEEFILINNVNPYTIKAGTYKVPVIK